MTSAHSSTIEYPDRTVYANNPAVYYIPFISADGCVGYVCRSNDGPVQRETYIYLNPSTDTDDGMPNVFVYVGGDNDPSEDSAEAHVVLDELA